LLAYQQARQTLLAELGVEPGAQLRELRRAILADDRPPTAARGSVALGSVALGSVALVGGRVKPAQLPAGVPGFTGREYHLQRLDALLPGGGGPHPALTIATISGVPGVGKTALAVHWARRVRDRFPDGQLYLNLRGYAAGRPLRPVDALATFLAALGVPATEVPDEVDAAAALYRSVLADQRVLVLLDNAGHADQVRPLLPGGRGCLVVTSRARLAGLAALDGAVPLRLDLLTPAESLRLLTRLLGADRMRAEPEASAELADLCGHLPLALCIAAASLCTHPGRSVADYAVRLRGDRLTALAVEDDPQAGVLAAFDLSRGAHPAPARRLSGRHRGRPTRPPRGP
jgi:hypothetical protein